LNRERLRAALSLIGADIVKEVKDFATKAGTASGCGNTGAALGYGAATVGLIGLEAVSFGRVGQMLGGTRAAGLEFSHSIPTRMGGPRTWWNGSMVMPEVHAMSDPFRMLAGMTGADKWPVWRQMLNRMPAWMQGLVGLGDAELLKLLKGQVDKDGCPCH
jgi:hypothetical protein